MDELTLRQRITLEIFLAMLSSGATSECRNIRAAMESADDFLRITGGGVNKNYLKKKFDFF